MVSRILCIVFAVSRQWRILEVILVLAEGLQILIIEQIISIFVHLDGLVGVLNCVGLRVCHYIECFLVSCLVRSIWNPRNDFFINIANRVALFSQLKTCNLVT